MGARRQRVRSAPAASPKIAARSVAGELRTAATLTESSLDHPAVQAAGQGNESDAVIVVAVLTATISYSLALRSKGSALLLMRYVRDLTSSAGSTRITS